MKAYVQFFVVQKQKWNNKLNKLKTVTPFLVEALGTDGVFQVDGRKTLENMKLDALTRMTAISNVQQYKHFQIRVGNIKSYEVIYSSFCGWTIKQESLLV